MNIGDVVKAPLSSTGATTIKIVRSGLTAEVNNEIRTNALIAADKNGEPHALLWYANKWNGVHHRLIKSCREWEDQDGNLVTGELKSLVDQAIANEPGK